MSEPYASARQAQPPARTSNISKHALAFTGTGGEFFRIWLVNLILKVLTLGIYTPFARRRTAVYFYNHSHVAGSPLTFSASIGRMMLGFLLITGLYALYELAYWLENELVVNLMLAMAALALPFLWGSAVRFRTRATRWRGIRPVFTASWAEVYRQSWPIFVIAGIWIALVVVLSFTQVERHFETASAMSKLEEQRLAVLSELSETDVLQETQIAKLQAESQALEHTLSQPPYDTFESSTDAYQHAFQQTWPWLLGLGLLGLLLSLPFVVMLDFNYRRLSITRTAVGQQHGHWKPVYTDFLRIWLATFGWSLLLLLIAVTCTGLALMALVPGSLFSPGNIFMMFGLVLVLIMLWIMLLMFALSPIMAYREARMFSLMWNNIGLGHMARFKSKLNVWAFVRLRLMNVLLIAITLGFYRPFALISEYRMKFESLTLYVKGDLDTLEGRLSQEQSALGDAFGDAIGLDLIG